MLSFPLMFKGHDLAIEALARLNDPRFRLIVIGRTEGVHYLQELKNKAAETGVEGQITFLGHRDSADDVYALLCGMDIFLMPSRREAFPLSIIEACACGLPVIASQVGGMPELISHENTGLLFRMGDSVALAEAIQRLTDDPKLRDQLAKQGQDNVLRRYSVANMLPPTIELYHSLVNSHA
jgi:glycosyltransferase involved in cell wall biosynthesis